MKTDRRFFKELRFRQLRALVELSRHKTFSAVASVLGLSVPSAWRQVRALEEQFGVQLVVAEGQQVSLTDDGRLLMKLAEPLVESFNSLRTVFDDRLERTQRKITVVAPSGVLSRELPKPLKRYRRMFPKVSRTLIDRPSRPAREMLEAGLADIAIVGLPHHAPPNALSFHADLPRGSPARYGKKDHTQTNRAASLGAHQRGIRLAHPA